MPFFRTGRKLFLDCHLLYGHIIKKINKISLQVRIPLKNRKPGKRVFFSASASMTLEAALALPLVLFAGIVLLQPLRILDVERQMQAIVNSVGEDISQLVYVTEEWSDAEWADTAAAIAYAEGSVRLKAQDLPVEWLTMIRSSILEEDAVVDLVVDYQMRMPFSVFGLGKIWRTNRCYLRAWVGAGGLEEEEDAEDETDPIVYVGKDSTRYHVSASCHYLSNHLTAVALRDLDSYRNKSGSRYTPCERCGAQAAGIVYIMPSGERYHGSQSCSAIQAYVTAVRRSTVEHLGPCSYCSRGK